MSAASSVTVSLTLKNVKVGDFIEWKIESKQTGAHATGHITENYGDKTWNFSLGDSDQEIWFWWDTLSGSADATVTVDNTVVFQGHCENAGMSERTMESTCWNPSVNKKVGPGPFLNNSKTSPVTFIEFE